ncbi:hypothetical protein ACFVFS_24010 [Kitasatospora sp. NPDC057692]|uniref:hypothetical protein n=1 Tax=Kitasatospora sp. NPDC057692 TaxID=3346215 RepID=UPI00368CCDA0
MTTPHRADLIVDAEIIEGEVLDPEPRPAPQPPPTVDAIHWYEGPSAWPGPHLGPAAVPAARTDSHGGYPPPAAPHTAGEADRAPYWWETPRVFTPPVPPYPDQPPTVGAQTIGAPAGAPTAATYAATAPTHAVPTYVASPYVAPSPVFGTTPSAPPCNPCRPGSLPGCGGCGANPTGPVPVELVAPQPLPVMIVTPPEPFWDLSWLQLQANATAAALAAAPAWLLAQHLPDLTGNYGVDAAAAVAALWGGKPALRSLAAAAAAYYATAALHTPVPAAAAAELAAIALPLAGTKLTKVSMLRRVAVWTAVLAGCCSLPAVSQALTWLTTAITGGN